MRFGSVKVVAVIVALAVGAAGLHGAAEPADASVPSRATLFPATHLTPSPPCQSETDGGVLAFDFATTGCLDGPGDIDEWTLDVDMAALVRSVWSSGGVCKRWSLRRRASDAPVFVDLAGSAFGDTGNGAVPVVLVPDEYILTVAAPAGVCAEPAVGEYRFTLERVPDVETFDITVGDTITDQQITSTGGVVRPAAGAANLERVRAVDTYRFTLATSQALYFDAFEASALMWVLRDSQNRVIFDKGLTRSPQPTYLAGGAYTLSVYGKDLSPRTYKFRLIPPPARQEFVATSYPLTVQNGAVNGQTRTGSANIETNGAVDTFTFPGAAGVVDIAFGFNTCGINLVIEAPTGARVYRRQASAHWYVTLPVAGTYKVVVSQFACPTGAYQLTIGNPTTTPGTTTTFKTATEIPASGASSLPLAISGSISAATNENVYNFTATVGQRLLFKAGTSTDADLQWGLYGPDGNPMFRNQSANLGLSGRVEPFMPFVNSRQLVRIPETGTYSLELRNTDAGTGTGTYNFDGFALSETVQNFSLGTLGTNELTVTASGSVNGTTRSGAGNIDAPGSQDVYTFTANAGQEVYPLATPNANVHWDLRAPDGVDIFNVDTGGEWWTGQLADTRRFTLAQTGTYTLRVFGVNDATTTYDFRLVPSQAQVFALGSLANGNPLTFPNATTATSGNGAGSIAKVGDHDVYSFEGRAGQLLYMRAESGVWGVGYTVRGPDGLTMPRVDGSAYNGTIDGDPGIVRLLRSGTYTITNFSWWSVGTGSYGMSLIPVQEPQAFDLGAPASGSTAVPNTTTAKAADGAGNINAIGTEDLFHVHADAGQRITIANATAAAGIRLELLGPDGSIQKRSDNGAFSDQPVSTLSSAALPRGGQYTLRVRSSGTTTGTYGFSLGVAGTASPSLFTQHISVSLDKTATTPTRIVPNDPDVGAGLIEQVNGADIVHIDAEAGDAVGFQFTKTDPELRLIGNHHTVGCIGVANDLEWTLRDPDGTVLSRQIVGCATGATNVLVLAKRGTYTVGISGADAIDSYNLVLWPHDSLREAAQPGQADPPPALSRVEPSVGTAGGRTTISLYGTNFSAPTAIRVTRGATELPVTLLEAHRVRGASEGEIATATVDLTDIGLAQPGNYTITVESGSGARALPFVVEAAVPDAIPELEVTANGADRLRAGALNRVYVNVANHMNSDVPVKIETSVPAEIPSMRTVTRIDSEAAVDTLLARGFSDAQIDEFLEALPKFVKDDPATGTSTLTPYLTIPAGGTAGITLEVLAPYPSGGTPSAADILAGTTATPSPPPASSGGAVGVQTFCEFLGTAISSLSISTWVPDNTGAQAALESWTKDFLDEYASDLPEVLREDIAGAFASVAFTMLTPAALIGMLVAVLLGYAVGATAPGYEQRLREVADLAQTLATREAIRQLLGSYVRGIKRNTQHVLRLVYKLVCDPNALIGPGTPAEEITDPPPIVHGGAVRAGERAHYDIQFENVGALPVKLVQTDIKLSDQLDWSTFQLEAIRLGTLDVAMERTGAWSWQGKQQVPINGTTDLMTVTANFYPEGNAALPDTPPGRLRVQFGGSSCQYDEFQPSTHCEILPTNTNAPEGEGSVRFSGKVRPLPIGTDVVQPPASIKFDPDQPIPPAPIDTNSWINTVRNDHPIKGNKLKLLNPSPARRKLGVQSEDPAIKAFGDPTCAGGGPPVQLDISTTAGIDSDTYTLPCTNWVPLPSAAAPTQYRYRDGERALGPIYKATIDVRNGRLKIDAKGDKLGHALASDPGIVSVTLSRGDERWCAAFGGKVRFRLGRLFFGRTASAPTGCAAAAPPSPNVASGRA